MNSFLSCEPVMPPGKCSFNDRWLKQPDYIPWLRQDTASKYSARCILCMKTFDISNMGESAIRSQARGLKHKQLKAESQSESGLTVRDFFGGASKTNIQRYKSREVDDRQVEQQPASAICCPTAGQSSSKTLSSYVIKSDCFRSEFLWTFKVINSHYSFNSCSDIQPMFAQMFPDSDIAKQFSCGEIKMCLSLQFWDFTVSAANHYEINIW